MAAGTVVDAVCEVELAAAGADRHRAGRLARHWRLLVVIDEMSLIVFGDAADAAGVSVIELQFGSEIDALVVVADDFDDILGLIGLVRLARPRDRGIDKAVLVHALHLVDQFGRCGVGACRRSAEEKAESQDSVA
jgi:hypothetical protein